MLAPCTVLNEAHDQAVAFLGLDDNGWDLGLTKLNICFDATLAADKIIACRVRLALSRANRDRTLEPYISYALYNFLKVAAISESWIQKANLINGNGLHSLRTSRFR